MAFDELPPDPYHLLGVAKDAKLPEIRSAHRKLVLKCHPDKVQDAALKAVKQIEFQKVQQAYELLSDDNRRLQYDEQVKLYALRKEMAGARGIPTARSNPFEYEVKTAEPRSTTYKYTARPAPIPREPSTSKVYPQQQRPNSYEDVVYEEPKRQPKKSASYESADRDQKSRIRDEDRARDVRRNEEDERARARWERENKRAAHGEKKKRDDKAKKRGAEEKYNSRSPYIEEESDDEYRAARSKEKARQERHRMEEEIRVRNEAARAEATREASRKTEAIRSAASKWDDHKEYAAQYMQAARRKATNTTTEDFHPRPIQRSETFGGPDLRYNIKYAAPPQPVPFVESDEDTPRRSQATRTSRRSSETPPSRSKETTKSSSKDKPREKDREKDRKKSARSRSRDPYIVEPPSPSLPPMQKQKPSLQHTNSAPPTIPVFPGRKEPSRSRTQDYPREAQPPTLPRASTFQSGDKAPERGNQRGSRLKKSVDYSSDSDSDAAVYTSNRHSHSPPPQSRRREASEPTRYIIDNGRSVPITARAPHRSEMRGIDDECPYIPRDRDRSESPHGTARHPRANERPPIPRAQGSSGARQTATRSTSTASYPPPPEAPEPIILTARPKMPPRESSHGHTTRSSPRGSGGAPPSGSYPFPQVKYGAAYRPEDVIYNNVYRRESDPTHHSREYAYAEPLPSGGQRVYA